MSYVLGFIVADGCITVCKERPNRPFSFNITSIDKKHLYKIRKILNSDHKIGKKTNGRGDGAFQIQIRNQVIAKDLMQLGIFPRKTSNLNPIKVPQKYFNSFARGFFDGDGSVYIYKVNGVPQIKAGFMSTSLSFFTDFNKQLCKGLDLLIKPIHKTIDSRGGKKLPQFNTHFYINDCEKLAEFMYKDNPALSLFRKQKIFKSWKSIKRRHYIKQNYPSKIGWHLNQKVLV